MTKTTKRKIGTYCQMCGADQGQPHQDQEHKDLIVVLAEYTGKMAYGKLLCQPCFQGATECDLEKSGTVEGLLARAARLQTEFWEVLGALEQDLGIEIDSTRDLEGMTIEDLKETAEEDDEADEDACDCADRSWYGEGHDTACPAGRPRQ